jgi:carbamoyl-phosphate synthase small subunit
VVYPARTPAEEILASGYDGVFLSNGPGDPAATEYAVATTRALLGRVPVFGICLGHQILALASGGTTYKLRFGHRGANQPVLDVDSGRVEITSHNHGFAVDPGGWGGRRPAVGHVSVGKGEAGPRSGGSRVSGASECSEAAPARGPVEPVTVDTAFGPLALTHWNLNDGTLEGMRMLDVPAFSVQYHPEAAPGPHDSVYLFDRFVELMESAA